MTCYTERISVKDLNDSVRPRLRRKWPDHMFLSSQANQMITEQKQGREAPVGASSYPIKNQRQDIKCLAFKIKSGPELYCNTTINTTNIYSNKLNFINI